MLFLLHLIIYLPVHSEVTLPRLISDGMVLQRQADVRIWGWAAAGEEVVIRFAGSTHQARANTDGRWAITLPRLEAGGPYDMVIQGTNTITIKNIMVGDVWLCSGQSNMELSMERASPLYADEIANCENPYIRQFVVPKTYNFNQPLPDLPGGQWIPVNPESIYSFSAVAYFFAQELYKKYKIPIGIINASLGGSPAEAWVSEEAIKNFPHHYKELQLYRKQEVVDSITLSDRARIDSWYNDLNARDEGRKQGWKKCDSNLSDWESCLLPGYWKDNPLEGLNGAVWFKKTFTLPDSLAGLAAKLNLGRIVDADSTFINGVLVGTTSYQYPPRRYKVPQGVLRPGANIMVVKVISNEGMAGFVPDKPYEMIIGNLKLDLRGEWFYRIGAIAPPLKGETFIRWKPVGLFNAMIHPLLNFAIKGVVWYQGESNTSRAEEYSRLLPTLITNWRESWGVMDLPFLIVQLPNFLPPQTEPGDSDWARLREAQLKALSVNRTALVVTIDLGEWNDIHPLNKKDVGVRLALAARRVAYNESELVHSGPTFKALHTMGSKLILTFDNTGRGLIAKKGVTPDGFAIAGLDRKFVWANARIVGNTIELWHDSIPKPVAVRYGWADNPTRANLYNVNGLPASPFRTDDW